MTRKLATTVFIILALSFTAFAQAPATPAPTGPAPTKIGVINIQAAIAGTNEGQRDLNALDKKYEPKRTELTNAQKELETLQKQLDTDGPKMAETARAALVKNIDTKRKTLQRNFEDAQSEFTREQNEIANRIGQKMMNILEKYANDNGYAVIFDVSGQTGQVLWAHAAVNLIRPIVDAYNAQSNVPPPPPEAPSAGAPGAQPRSATPARPATSPRPAATPR